MRGRTLVASVAVVAALCLAGVGVAVALGGGAPAVASGGDPNVVTTTQLKEGLAKIGAKIRYVDAREPVPALVGLASKEPTVPIGFEYQVFPSSDQATVAHLGKLSAQTFGWRKPTSGIIFEPLVRGVLGNVAYAVYEDNEHDRHRRPHETAAEAHRFQLAAQAIRRGLDDALFDAFPADDPYANALSPTP
jgi:hypothetical protein